MLQLDSLDLRRLRAFHLVAKHGNLRLAAARLYRMLLLLLPLTLLLSSCFTGNTALRVVAMMDAVSAQQVRQYGSPNFERG